MDISILLPLRAPLSLWRRTLWAMANRPPSCSFEVVVAATSTSGLEELSLYSSQFRWRYLHCEKEENLIQKAVEHASGRILVTQDARVIVWGNGYDELVRPVWSGETKVSLGRVWAIPYHVLIGVDAYGSELNQQQVAVCRRWPMATPDIFLCEKGLLQAVNSSGATIQHTETWPEEFSQTIGLCQSDQFSRWLPPVPERPTSSRVLSKFLSMKKSPDKEILGVWSNVCS